MSLIDANRRSAGLMFCSAAADDEGGDVKSRYLALLDAFTSHESTVTSSMLVVVLGVFTHTNDASRSHTTRLICVIHIQRLDHGDVIQQSSYSVETQISGVNVSGSMDSAV